MRLPFQSDTPPCRICNGLQHIVVCVLYIRLSVCSMILYDMTEIITAWEKSVYIRDIISPMIIIVRVCFRLERMTISKTIFIGLTICVYEERRTDRQRYECCQDETNISVQDHLHNRNGHIRSRNLCEIVAYVSHYLCVEEDSAHIVVFLYDYLFYAGKYRNRIARLV